MLYNMSNNQLGSSHEILDTAVYPTPYVLPFIWNWTLRICALGIYDL